jgi:serine/threonine-protein kinase
VAEAKSFGRYQLRERIAVGGMAEIHAAHLITEDGRAKKLIVKLIHESLASNPRFLEMFISEARISASLQHENIVPVFDFGNIDGRHYIAMEWVDGIDLRTAIDTAHNNGVTFDQDVAAHIVLEVLRGLDHAHQKRDASGAHACVIHRDVNPKNILVSREGAVKLIDFGIAKLKESHGLTGRLVGTLDYMAPEQARGLSVDERSDLFSAGLVLYVLLTLVSPFTAESPAATVERAIGARVPEIELMRNDLHPELIAIVNKLLARRPEDRYDNAAVALSALDGFLSRERMRQPTRASPTERLALLVRHWTNATSPDHQITDVSALSSWSTSNVRELIWASKRSEDDPNRDQTPTITRKQEVPAELFTEGEREERTRTIAEQTIAEIRANDRPRRGRMLWLAAPLAVALALWGWSLRPPQSKPESAPQGEEAAIQVAPVVITEPPPLDPSRSGPQPARSTTVAVSADPTPARAEPPRPTKSAPPRRRPAFGTLNLNATPWAYASVDGAEPKLTPIVGLRVAAGAHRVVLENAKLSKKKTITIMVKPNASITSVVDMNR